MSFGEMLFSLCISCVRPSATACRVKRWVAVSGKPRLFDFDDYACCSKFPLLAGHPGILKPKIAVGECVGADSETLDRLVDVKIDLRDQPRRATLYPAVYDLVGPQSNIDRLAEDRPSESGTPGGLQANGAVEITSAPL